MHKKLIHKLTKRRRLQLIQRELQIPLNSSEDNSTSNVEGSNLVSDVPNSIANVFTNKDDNDIICNSNNAPLTNLSLQCLTQQIDEPQHFENDLQLNFVMHTNIVPNVANELAGTSTGATCQEFRGISGDTGNTLQMDLRKWILENNISHSAANSLLRILNKHGYSDLLPLMDIRTLLCTPRKTKSRVIAMGNGKYVHMGLGCGISSFINVYFDKCPDRVKINLNIDGLPLCSSSTSQFWPIMGSVDTEFLAEPFIIGIYQGLKKPSDVNAFLRPFVDETKDLIKDAVWVNGKRVMIEINAIICDAPAKAFVCCIKGHSGYFGCSKFTQEGDFFASRVTFPSLNDCLRTDESFKNRQQEEHHLGTSCLEELDIGMVSQIPLDYMHLVCLGVMKKLLLFWVRGKGNIKLKPAVLDSCSNNYINLKFFVCYEFARKPRSLHDVDRWKATEFRLILLYLGMVVFKEFLSQDYYYHFLSLSVAIRILADTTLCHKLHDYAKTLLQWFVECFGHLYGQEFYSYNVHNLLHLTDDVKKFGALDQFSAFQFENHMQKIKKKIVPNGRELQQLTNRLEEIKHLPLEKKIPQSFPYPKYFKTRGNSSQNQIKKLQFNGFCISCETYNNCCQLEDGAIVLISNIYEERNTFYLTTESFISLRPFFNTPCNSQDLGISVGGETEKRSRIITSAEIKRKCMVIKLEQEKCEYLIIPLLHKSA